MINTDGHARGIRVIRVGLIILLINYLLNRGMRWMTFFAAVGTEVSVGDVAKTDPVLRFCNFHVILTHSIVIVNQII